MQKYKLIISDFDGTLGGKNEVISSRVSDAIKKWVSSGGEFSIATGKSYLRIKKNIEELGLKTPQIVMGGAEIVKPDGSKLYSQPIDKDIAMDFITLMDSNGYGLTIDTNDHYYSNPQADYHFSNSLITHLALDEFTPQPVPKIIVRISDKPLEEVERFSKDVLSKRYPELHIIKTYGPAGGAWDVTSVAATKHLAALELMKITGVVREETVGVGDGYNDFPLLEACGYKVAMGSAPDDLKVIADLVVPTYQEDGVAVLIDKLLAESNT